MLRSTFVVSAVVLLAASVHSERPSAKNLIQEELHLDENHHHHHRQHQHASRVIEKSSRTDNCTKASGCECDGTSATECPQDGFCDPSKDTCSGNNPVIDCGKYGDFLQCKANGAVIGECGSAKNDDCSEKGGCNTNSYEGIECNYPSMAPTTGYSTTSWLCGGSGTYLSCQGIAGSVLTGVCGSGKNKDCDDLITGCHGYHAIQCAKASYFEMDWTNSTWVMGSYGEWVYCPEDTIACGHCGSGHDADCGKDVWHALQCCPLIYYQ